MIIPESFGTSYVTSNDDYNVIYALDYYAALDYTNAGGNDIVISNESSSDKYTTGIYRDKYIHIRDCGGSDTLNIITDNVDDLRIYTAISKSNGVYNWDEARISIFHKDDFTVNNLLKIRYGTQDVGLNIVATGTGYYQTNGLGIENIQINGNTIDKTAWFNAIKESVSSWLDSAHVSLSEAFEIYENNPNDLDISGLVAAYTSVKYTDVYAT